MKIYYSKYPIYPFDLENKTMGVIEYPYKDIQEYKIFHNKPQVKETDFRSGKERRRDRRKEERIKKIIMKRVDIAKAAVDSCVIENDIFNPQLTPYYEQGFKDGANWRINSVWHDARTEIPQEQVVYCADW